jgi:large subunit ribosomal protein L31
MKEKIHPKYYQVEVECDCGNTFKVGSTRKDKIHVEICAACHPLYTGKQKLVDSTGRVKRFKAMVEKGKKLKKEKKTSSKKSQKRSKSNNKEK